jgi:hypothetical protein
MISRGMMNRQLYEVGTVPPKIKRLALALNITEEEAGKIMSSLENPEITGDVMTSEDKEVMERLMLKQQGPDYQYNEENLYEGSRDMRAGGGIMSLTPRQEYGLGSIVKSVGKAVSGAVKGVTKAAKSIVSSDVGKLALLAAGGYYLGGGFGAGGFKFGNIGTSLFGTPLTLPPGMSTVSGKAFGSKGLLGAAGKFAPFSGSIASSISSGLSSIPGGLKTLGVLGGSALGALFGTKEEAFEAFQRDPEAVKTSLASYYRNINKKATEQEVTEFVNKNIAEFGDVSRSDVVSGYESGYGRAIAAQGGIMDIPMGEPRMNQGGVPELDYRQEGGFVPVGIKEKADDVPAMLSKNEFVMTADAVRGMGNGNIETGAQKMYNLMKSMENRIA